MLSISEEEVQINRRVATEIMGEPMPPELKEEDFPESPFFAIQYLPIRDIETENWCIVEVYEEGDVPRWEARNFCNHLPSTFRAVEAFSKGIEIKKTPRGISILCTSQHEWEYDEGGYEQLSMQRIDQEVILENFDNLALELCELMLDCLEEKDDD